MEGRGRRAEDGQTGKPANRKNMNSSIQRENNRPARILIVDDDRALNKYLARMLEDMGYECARAYNAQEARQSLEHHSFSLILCDINMPGESGLDLMAEVLSSRSDTAVIMISAVEDRNITRQAIDMGVYSYLVKPFSKSQLLVSIDNALRRLDLETRLRTHIAELQKALEQLRSANLKIQELHLETLEKERLKVLLEFAGAAAHELNQPLTSLLGNVELIERFPLDGKTRDSCLGDIARSGHLIADIVRKIQNISNYRTKTYFGEEKIIDLDRACGRIGYKGK